VTLVNFVRVLMCWRCSAFFGENVLGGEDQRGSLNSGARAILKKPNVLENHHMEPISQSMQKTVGGLLVLVFSAVNCMLEKRYVSIWSVLGIECTNQ